MIPVPQNVPDGLRQFCLDVSEAIQELETPTYPHKAYRAASTALPPATRFDAGCIIDLTDLNTVAKSDGTNWRRVDTGAIL